MCPNGGSEVIDCPITSYMKISGQTECMLHDATSKHYINSNDEEILCPEGYMCPGGDSGKIFCQGDLYQD